MILPYRANLSGCDFWERQGSLDEFKFKVRVTPAGTNLFTKVYNGTYSGIHYHSVQEVMPANLLQPSETAQINFSWQGGDGEIEIEVTFLLRPGIRVNADPPLSPSLARRKMASGRYELQSNVAWT